MPKIVLSEPFVRSAATLAVGCCAVAVGATAMPILAAPLIGIASVVGAAGFSKLFKDKPECEMAVTETLRRFARELVLADEVDESAASEAQAALKRALDLNGLFTTNNLEDALRKTSKVVDGLTTLTLDGVARADPSFSAPGFRHEFAREVLGRAFMAARISCQSFRDQAGLTIQEITLSEIREINHYTSTISKDVSQILYELRDMKDRGDFESAKVAGLTNVQVDNILKAFAHEGVPTEKAEELLIRSANELQILRSRLEVILGEEPEIAALRDSAKAAIADGDFGRADNLLARAEVADIQVGERHILRGAETMFERSILARSQARWLEAANHCQRAAAAAAPFSAQAAWQYRLSQAEALYEHGILFPGHSLQEAVELYRDICLPLTPRETRPFQWAHTQDRLGCALSALGERAGNKNSLIALTGAAEAHRAALEIFTQDTTPLEWGLAQNNLGAALQTLGERADSVRGPEALTEAVNAHRNALQVFSRESNPPLWAMAQSNLANSLSILSHRATGQYSIGTALEAIETYKSILEVYTRENSPRPWAAAQQNLGNLFTILGSRPGDEGVNALNMAVKAYRAALEIQTREAMPALWTMTQSSLGNALYVLAGRSDNIAPLATLYEAAEAYRAALEIRSRESMPSQWAFSTENLAIVESTISRITKDADLLISAIRRMTEVVLVFEDIESAFNAKKARTNLANMKNLLAGLGS